MALARFTFAVAVPSVGSRPPLLHTGIDVRINALHLVLGGLVAAVIVWVAVGTPVPVVPERGETDEASTGSAPRLTRI